MWIENQDNLDKAQSLASQALSHLKLWGAEKLDQALVQPASHAIEHTAKTVKQARAAAIDATSDYIIAPTANAWNAVAQGVTRKYEGVVAATSRGMENTANAANQAVDTTVRVARGTKKVAEFAWNAVASGVKQARAAAIDATSDYIIAPTAKAWNAVAQGVTRKYEGAVAATSRGMENTANAVQDTKKSVTTKMNRAAEVAIGTWQVILDVYDSGANPEKYQQVVDIKQKPKTKVANKPNKPVWEKKNAG